MDWIELIIHTTTEGSDEVSSLLMEAGASGTMIEDRADIPDPAKPHGIWEIIDPNLPDSMPEDVLVHAWLEPADSFPVRLEQIRSALALLSAGESRFGSCAWRPVPSTTKPGKTYGRSTISPSTQASI